MCMSSVLFHISIHAQWGRTPVLHAPLEPPRTPVFRHVGGSKTTMPTDAFISLATRQQRCAWCTTTNPLPRLFLEACDSRPMAHSAAGRLWRGYVPTNT